MTTATNPTYVRHGAYWPEEPAKVIHFKSYRIEVWNRYYSIDECGKKKAAKYTNVPTKSQLRDALEIWRDSYLDSIPLHKFLKSVFR